MLVLECWAGPGLGLGRAWAGPGLVLARLGRAWFREFGPDPKWFEIFKKWISDNFPIIPIIWIPIIPIIWPFGNVLPYNGISDDSDDFPIIPIIWGLWAWKKSFGNFQKLFKWFPIISNNLSPLTPPPSLPPDLVPPAYVPLQSILIL